MIRKVIHYPSVVLLFLAISRLASSAEPLRVGTAERDITPPTGFPIAGYYHERLAEGTIDPLKAKAMVFEQGSVRAALVVCDLTAISRDLCLAVRQRASRSTGIPPEAIAISATHSHTAPDYGKYLFKALSAGADAKADAKTAYAHQLIDNIAQAIVDAHQKLAPADIHVGSAQQQVPIAFNRRFVMKDGSVQTWKNLKDPQVVRAAGPIDPQVNILAIKSAQTNNEQVKAQTLGVLSNFALHLDTVGGMRWSADYPYFVEQKLRKSTDENGLVSIFGTGCCGDINHSDPSRSERNKTDFIGNSLGDTVVQAMSTATKISSNQLQVRATEVRLPLQEVSSEQLQRSVQLLDVIASGGKVEFLDQVAAYKTVMLANYRGLCEPAVAEKYLSWGLSKSCAGIGSELPVDVQAITLGDEVAIVFLPGEVFVDLGLAIKRGSRFPNTIVIELSNAVETAYIPTHAATAVGSYEVTNSTVKPGAGEMLVAAALQLLKR